MKLKLFTSIIALLLSFQMLKATCTSAPSNLSQIQNGAEITLSWNDNGASSYIVEARDPLYPWNDPSSFSVTVNTNTFVFPFGIQGFTFEWRVKAVCVAGEFTSNSSTFATECATANTIQAQDISFDTVRLTWTFNGFAGEPYSWSVGYRVLGSTTWIPLQFTNGGYLSTSTTQNFGILNGLTPGTTYEWCVNQFCPFSQAMSDPVIGQFTTLTPSCPTPLSYPASNITANSAILNWQALPQASSYYIQWFINNSPLPSGTATVTSNSYFLAGLQPGSGVLYRVSANCPFVNGYNFSTFASFETPNIPPPPPPVSSFFIDYFKLGSIERVSGAEPAGYINTGFSTQVVAGQRYQFKVSMGSVGAYTKQNYAFYLDMNGNGTLENNERLFGVGAAFNANIITLNLTIPSTSTPGLARLRVIMKTANGGIQPNQAPGANVEIEDYWLDIQSSSSLIGQTESSFNLKMQDVVFENPTNGLLKLSIMNQVNQIKILNQIGQVVFNLSNIQPYEDPIIDLTSHKNGIYFMELSYPNGTIKVEKLLVKH
jgi:hypothetical protein